MATTVISDLDLALVTPPVAPKVAWSTVLVATDGSAESDPAVSVARHIASRQGAALRAISVTEAPPQEHEFGWRTPSPDEGPTARATLVEAQFRRVRQDPGQCPLVIRTGTMPEEVRHHARDLRADLVVTGRGRHGGLERLLGDVHLLRLLAHIETPVLAVDARLSALPRRIVIGVDFSAQSFEAARTAIELAAPDAALYLVHVKPDPPFGLPHPGQWLSSYDDGVRAGLERLRLGLGLPPSRVVETIVVHGHPGVALADFARTAGADLIAVGLQGAGFINRLVIGSVSAYLVRSAPCSLLFLPPTGATAAPRTTA